MNRDPDFDDRPIADRVDRDFHREPRLRRERSDPDQDEIIERQRGRALAILRAAGLLILIALAPACAVDDEPLPTCADLGCPVSPSGSPEAWEPCEGETCFCAAEACSMEATP